jgi:oxygen-independent coproporphyrinogen III oxidase
MKSYEQVKQVTNHAREIGYTSINFDLIYGLPLQTVSGIEDTVKQ